MANVLLSPIGNGYQFLGTSLVLLSGGTLTTYLAGTSTLQATYTTNLGTITNSNPITLNSDGRPPSEIWLVSGVSYKFVLQDALSNVIATWDNLYGIPLLGSAPQFGATASGTSDALVLTPATPISSYITGQGFLFFAASVNTTTTPTIAISGLLPVTLTNRQGGALDVGAIQPGLQLGVYDGSTVRLFGIDSKLSIGVSSPSYKLDISDNQNASTGARITNPNSGSSARAQILLNNDSGGVGSGLFKNSSANSGALGGANAMNLINGSAAPFVFGVNSSKSFQIESDNSVLGLSLVASKPANTTRTSTTTLTDDPDLILSLVSGRRYLVRFVLLAVNLTGAGQGLQVQANFTGANSQWTGLWNYNAIGATPTVSYGGNNTVAPFATWPITGTNMLIFEGLLITTGNGNLSLQWAQNSSSPNGTQIALGSSLTVTPVG